MFNLLNDLTYAFRVVLRDKTFAVATVLTLGLCIAAHTASIDPVVALAE